GLKNRARVMRISVFVRCRWRLKVQWIQDCINTDGVIGGLDPAIHARNQLSRLSRALSFRKATRSRSDCAAFAGPITDTSTAVRLSIAVIFTALPTLMTSK